MARGLSSLPNETLCLILGHFCLHCSRGRNYDSPDGHFRHPCPQDGEQDQDPDEPAWYSQEYRSTLYSMCLVSKHFQPVAQSVLHHEFIPGYGDAWRSQKFSWDGRLPSFVRTLAARPDLAAVVKRIYIHSYLLQAAAGKEAESVQEMVGMLLALVPNLKRLSFVVEEGDAEILSKALSPGATSSPLRSRPRMQLDALDICDRSLDVGDGHHTSKVLEAMANVSTFATLNLHMFGSSALHLQPGSLRDLSAVRITYSRLTTSDLASLFDSFAPSSLKSFVYETAYPRLRSLTYCVVPPEMEAFGPSHFEPSDVVQQLARHKTTLKSLHLDFRLFGLPGTYYQDIAPDARPLSKTLRDFTALRDVYISASLLYNHHGRATYTDSDSTLLTALLPPTTTSLHLNADLDERALQGLARALLALAKASGPLEQFASLRRVRCDKTQAAKGLSGYPIAEAFAASGVDFGYESWPSGEPTLRWQDQPPTVWLDDAEANNVPLPDDDDDL